MGSALAKGTVNLFGRRAALVVPLFLRLATVAFFGIEDFRDRVAHTSPQVKRQNSELGL